MIRLRSVVDTLTIYRQSLGNKSRFENRTYVLLSSSAMIRRLLPDPGVARVLTLATFVNTLGNGLWMTSSALFLHRSVGLSVTQIAIGLTVTGLVTAVASTPLGYLADRYGPRGMQMLFLAVTGVLTIGLAMISNFPQFVLLASLIGIADAGARGARGAVIAGAVPADLRVRTRAYLRATTNLGIS